MSGLTPGHIILCYRSSASSSNPTFLYPLTMTFQEKTSRSGILANTLHACQVSPNLDKHAEHGVPEAEPEPRVPVVRVRARAQTRFHRAAPLAEAEQSDVGVLVGRLRRGLEEPERLRELAMGAERSQLRARVRRGGGGRRRRDGGRAETA